MDNSWWVMIGAAVSVYLVIGVGALVRTLGWLTEEADQSLLQLIIRLLMPCLIFTVITDNAALKEPQNVLLPPLVGFGAILLGYGVALLVTRLSPRLHGMHDPRQFATFALAVGMFNYGYIPLPLVKLLFDDETLGVLFVHNLGVEVALWTFGVMLLSGHVGQKFWRRMLNPMSVTICVALLFNFTGAAQYLPDFLTRGMGWLGDSAIPLSLILVGATIADHLRRSEAPPQRIESAKTAFWACLLRLGVLPLAMLLIAWMLPATTELRRVVVVQSRDAIGHFSDRARAPLLGQPQYGAARGTEHVGLEPSDDPTLDSARHGVAGFGMSDPSTAARPVWGLRTKIGNALPAEGKREARAAVVTAVVGLSAIDSIAVVRNRTIMAMIAMVVTVMAVMAVIMMTTVGSMVTMVASMMPVMASIMMAVVASMAVISSQRRRGRKRQAAENQQNHAEPFHRKHSFCHFSLGARISTPLGV